jgi:NodT family efflux transporter outer membrane factor (OMF) lipoprotein
MKTFARSSSTKLLKCAVATALICSVLPALSGCGIPKLCKPEPGPCLPPEYNGVVSGENTSLVSTYEFFNDPNLIGLIDQALMGNQELRILNQDIAIANNEVMKRRGSYLPFITLGGGASLDKLSTYTPPGADLATLTVPGTTSSFPNPLPDFMVATNLSWQIDIWRQLRNARDAASLRYLGTIDGRNYVVTRLIAEIAETYYGLMALDKQLETLDRTITLQEQSLLIAKARKEAARDTELAVQRFQAEVRKNQSEKLIIYQRIIEAENRINFLCGRYPQRVERPSVDSFIELNLHALEVGFPTDLLQNRPDIRQAERELAAAGLDVRVARANFYPKLMLRAGVGYEALNARYLFVSPETLIYNVAGDLVMPLINKTAIRADYLTANAKQLQAVYEYQRKILNAFTEVINRLNKVQNYSNSIEIKKQQLASLEEAVDVASNLFQNARVEYIDVLFAQRDRNEARMVIIDTKKEQLSAIINAYQALGGGWQNRPQIQVLPPVESEQPQPPPEAIPLLPNTEPAAPVPAPNQ